MFWAGLIIGLVIGGFAGVLVMALAVVARRNEEPRP